MEKDPGSCFRWMSQGRGKGVHQTVFLPDVMVFGIAVTEGGMGTLTALLL